MVSLANTTQTDGISWTASELMPHVAQNRSNQNISNTLELGACATEQNVLFYYVEWLGTSAMFLVAFVRRRTLLRLRVLESTATRMLFYATCAKRKKSWFCILWSIPHATYSWRSFFKDFVLRLDSACARWYIENSLRYPYLLALILFAAAVK